jgi:hypothetical protein
VLPAAGITRPGSMRAFSRVLPCRTKSRGTGSERRNARQPSRHPASAAGAREPVFGAREFFGGGSQLVPGRQRTAHRRPRSARPGVRRGRRPPKPVGPPGYRRPTEAFARPERAARAGDPLIGREEDTTGAHARVVRAGRRQEARSNDEVECPLLRTAMSSCANSHRAPSAAPVIPGRASAERSLSLQPSKRISRLDHEGLQLGVGLAPDIGHELV